MGLMFFLKIKQSFVPVIISTGSTWNERLLEKHPFFGLLVLVGEAHEKEKQLSGKQKTPAPFKIQSRVPKNDKRQV